MYIDERVQRQFHRCGYLSTCPAALVTALTTPVSLNAETGEIIGNPAAGETIVRAV